MKTYSITNGNWALIFNWPFLKNDYFQRVILRRWPKKLHRPWYLAHGQGKMGGGCINMHLDNLFMVGSQAAFSLHDKNLDPWLLPRTILWLIWFWVMIARSLFQKIHSFFFWNALINYSKNRTRTDRGSKIRCIQAVGCWVVVAWGVVATAARRSAAEG